ncbi:MAG: SLATT domain-containing protein, partial [Myxococcales bacterium]|nr:SLATT domain-containing protein [Myxococcales bacterium]
MLTVSPPPEHLVAACKRIEDDCLYTAQTHFEMASQKARRAKGWLVLLPSVVSSGSGLAVALGAPAWVGGFAALAGAISAAAAYLGVERDASAHEVAGKLLTQLRHEARAVRDSYSPNVTSGQFEGQVLALQQRYGAFVASLPLTDDDAFEKARKRIQAGRFTYDSEAPASTGSQPASALPAQSSPEASPEPLAA